MGNQMLHLGLLHHVKHEHAFENRWGNDLSDLIALHQCCPLLLSTRMPCCRYLFYRWACRSITGCRQWQSGRYLPKIAPKEGRAGLPSNGPILAAQRASKPPDHTVAAWPVCRVPELHYKAEC